MVVDSKYAVRFHTKAIYMYQIFGRKNANLSNDHQTVFIGWIVEQREEIDNIGIDYFGK